MWMLVTMNMLNIWNAMGHTRREWELRNIFHAYFLGAPNEINPVLVLRVLGNNSWNKKFLPVLPQRATKRKKKRKN